MIKTSELWKDITATNDFGVNWNVSINGVSYDMTEMYSIGIESPLFSSLSVGNFCSAQLSVSVIPKEEIPKMAKIIANMQVISGDKESEFVQRGVFYIGEREESDSGILSITSYDSALLSEVDFISPGEEIQYEWPAKPAQVMDTICKKLGVELDERTSLIDENIVQFTDPEISCRDMACDIASAHAGNWVVTNEGKWLLVPLASSQDTIDVGKSIVSLSTKKQLKPITKVTVIAGEGDSGEELVYVAGDDENGSNLDVYLSWGDQSIADRILSLVSGFVYSPYSATGAIIDPAFEIGDGFVSDPLSSFIANASISASGTVDVEAPGEDDIQSEIPYKSGETSKLGRKLKSAYASFSVATSEIKSEVSGIKTDLGAAKDDLQGQITDQAGQIQELEQKTSLSITQDQVEIIVSEAINGIDSVTTSTGFRFDEEGMTVSSTESEFSAMTRPFGFYVKRGEENVMVADSNGVEAINLTVNKFLNIANRFRIEPYGTDRVACFPIGG